jgi:hypothetical protein
MNTTIAKVIAFELGILIAILTWMALPDSPERALRSVPKLQQESDQSFASVSPVLKAKKRRLQAIDYPAEEVSTPIEETEPIQTVETYAQEIAAEPYVEPGYADYPAVADPTTYIGDYPEPVLYGPDCFVPSVYPVVSYQQPAQVIVISNARSSGRRHRLTARPRGGGGRPMVAHRSPRREAARTRRGGFDSHRNVPPGRGAVTPPRAANTQSGLTGQRTRTRPHR